MDPQSKLSTKQQSSSVRLSFHSREAETFASLSRSHPLLSPPPSLPTRPSATTPPPRSSADGVDEVEADSTSSSSRALRSRSSNDLQIPSSATRALSGGRSAKKDTSPPGWKQRGAVDNALADVFVDEEAPWLQSEAEMTERILLRQQADPEDPLRKGAVSPSHTPSTLLSEEEKSEALAQGWRPIIVDRSVEASSELLRWMVVEVRKQRTRVRK